MEKLIKQTRLRLFLIMVLVIVTVLISMWGLLQIYNSNEIASQTDISFVHSRAQGNVPLQEYISEQKDFEAHFVSLANAVRDQDSRQLTDGLIIVTFIMITIGMIIAYVVSRQLMKPVVEAYESQERFIQDAAHELRNPLAAMNAALQSTSKENLKSPLVIVFRRQLKRMISINEDLLFLDRRSTKKVEDLNLKDLIEEIIEEIQPIASRRKIKITTVKLEDISKNMSSSDFVRLVKNIIDNAVKYSRPGGEVKVSMIKMKNEIEIKVVDQGIGMPKEDIVNIGRRFYRAKNIGNIEGTGLGIAIVKKILNIYNGKLLIESKIGEGSTFIIKLPA